MSPLVLRRLRRASQAGFFLLFLFLLVRTEFRGSFQEASGAVRVPYPVAAFFQVDPLVAVTTALSTRALYRGLAWSLIILVATIFVGRFFCGWICPFGTLNHLFASMKSERKRGAALIESNRYKRWHATKYYLLAGGLVAAVLGSAAVCLVDPISLLVRSFAVAVIPALSYGANGVVRMLDAAGNRPASALADVLQPASQWLLTVRQPLMRQAVPIAVVLVLVLAANFRVTRFWCRGVCPLGALLGVASRWSLIGLRKKAAACDHCKRCQLHCQGGDDPIPGTPWRRAECVMCMNCAGDCPKGALSFGPTPVPHPDRVEVPELQRRKLLTGLAAGTVLVPLVRSGPGLAGDADSRLIRPPGTVDEAHFLERCLRCGECMKVCPTNALQPSLAEGGLEAIWTPVVVPHVGYCEPNCVLCGQVCPTGAIWPLTEAQKRGKASLEGSAQPPAPVKIGTAFYDHGRCLPWAMGTDCIVCEEWCPNSPKAIYLVAVDVTTPDGTTKTVKQPHVDPRRCTGCGACEHACPVKDRPAVYVTSVGESRSKTNQFVLQPPVRRAR
jgi:polyferredoxin